MRGRLTALLRPTAALLHRAPPPRPGGGGGAPALLASLSRPLLAASPATTPFAAARNLATRPVKPHRIYPQWTSPPPQHELWKPNAWLGAYYKLREGDPAAERNRAKLMGKRTTRRGKFIISQLDYREQVKREQAEPWRKMPWRPGTYVEVDHTPRVGEHFERVVGVILQIKRNKRLGSSFRLLCYVDGTPVEYQFMAFSPLLLNVTVRQESQWRDGKPNIAFNLRPEVHKLPYPKANRMPKQERKVDNDPSRFSGRSRGEQA